MSKLLIQFKMMQDCEKIPSVTVQPFSRKAGGLALPALVFSEPVSCVNPKNKHWYALLSIKRAELLQIFQSQALTQNL
ncbi:MAG: hypothetical protein ACOCPN_02285 [Desulfonatronovibrionaceae bacterium]